MRTLLFTFLLAGMSANGFTQSANMQTVMANYARFGQGDIPGIIATLADNIVWVHPGNSDLVAFAGTFESPGGVGRFFEAVGSTVQISVFQPSNFRENGNMVVNDVHIEGTVLATGKNYRSDVAMHWTFDANGKVARWEATGDVTGLEAACTR